MKATISLPGEAKLSSRGRPRAVPSLGRVYHEGLTRSVSAIRLACIAGALAAATAGIAAQQPARYVVPRTEFRRPDFQGVWETQFLTMLEPPPNVKAVTVTAEQAREIAADMVKNAPVLSDPDTAILGINQLAVVKGEYRTGIVVDPPDGRIPFTPAGLELLAKVQDRNRNGFDDPEQRPLAERCLENLVYAPIRTVPVLLPRQIVQTRDYVVIYAEDVPGTRIIPLGVASAALPSVGGSSSGHWDGETLVIETTNFLARDPARAGAGRPILITPRTLITERFTRVSATELVYRYTVRDAEMYTQPWTGEFSMTRHDGPIYEASCHEANYSMTNMLRGGRAHDKDAPPK